MLPVYTVGRYRIGQQCAFPGDVPVISVERGGDVTTDLVAGRLPDCSTPSPSTRLARISQGLEAFWIELLDRHFEIKASHPQHRFGLGAKAYRHGNACRKWTIWHGFSGTFQLT